MAEIDAELDLETVVGFKSRRLVALGDFDSFQYADEFFRDRLLFYAR